ncbi:MAG TPA: hypothetical protein VLA17_14990 [Candidatus Limnocylindria bacterium]|nr:hypothetical protein [Candidatus Limnocylindria bacterium]
MKMEFNDDRVSISANNPDLGEAVEEIEADYKGKSLVLRRSMLCVQ